MLSDVCNLCETPLLTAFDAEQGPSQVPDDVKTHCFSSHRFHWACLLEHYTTPRVNRTQCPAPSCGRSVLDSRGQFLVDVRNEGGLTQGFDFGAELEQEDRVISNPLERHVEIFLELIAQGDIEDAEQMFLQYQFDINHRDENGEYATALHVAAQNDDVEATRMLLRNGADKALVMSNGMTPLQVAEAVGAMNAARALME